MLHNSGVLNLILEQLSVVDLARFALASKECATQVRPPRLELDLNSCHDLGPLRSLHSQHCLMFVKHAKLVVSSELRLLGVN